VARMSTPLDPWKQPRCWGWWRAVWVSAVALLVSLVVGLLRRTWRVRVAGTPPLEGSLVAFWHGDQLALTGARLSPLPTVLVSLSRDGQLAAEAAGRLGYTVVRGSSSRGAVRGALALARRLLAGRSVALAVDGPRGPRHRTGGAPVRLARMTDAPLIPAAAVARRGAVLSSWDRLQIPSPFTTVCIVFGSPVSTTGDLQQAMERARERARSASWSS
jgi:lysophospholipid acyltransferase (LPLAT)-like uncharacterized protein